MEEWIKEFISSPECRRRQREFMESMNFPTTFYSDRRPYTEQGEKMVEIVKNIASESEKCGYNPEKDTNWCHLPVEIREKCIKNMDFERRFYMRSTEIERSFVDAHKYHFEKMKIETRSSWNRRIRGSVPKTSISLELTKSDPLSRGGMEKVEIKIDEEDIPFSAIDSLKNCDFGEIQCFSFGSHPSNNTGDLRRCAPFRFKSLKSKGGNLYMVHFLLENSEGDVEKISLNVKHEEDFSVEHFFRFPSFYLAKEVVVEFMALKDMFSELKKMLDKWSEHDVEIGTELHFSTDKLYTLIRGNERKNQLVRFPNNDSKAFAVVTFTNSRARQEEIMARVIRKPAPGQAEGTR